MIMWQVISWNGDIVARFEFRSKAVLFCIKYGINPEDIESVEI